MIIGVYKGAGYGQYALIDTFFAEDDEQATTAERKYSSSCAFVREDDENHEFPKTMNASRFES